MKPEASDSLPIPPSLFVQPSCPPYFSATRKRKREGKRKGREEREETSKARECEKTSELSTTLMHQKVTTGQGLGRVLGHQVLRDNSKCVRSCCFHPSPGVDDITVVESVSSPPNISFNTQATTLGSIKIFCRGFQRGLRDAFLHSQIQAWTTYIC